jgi:hypothetical protein
MGYTVPPQSLVQPRLCVAKSFENFCQVRQLTDLPVSASLDVQGSLGCIYCVLPLLYDIEATGPGSRIRKFPGRRRVLTYAAALIAYCLSTILQPPFPFTPRGGSDDG